MKAAQETTGEGRHLHILLVEDSAWDAKVAVEAFQHASRHSKVEVVLDGSAALRRLRDPNLARPDLVLLDLNLPKVDGREVLAEVKSDPSLRRIPVIVLTTSRAHTDVAIAYDLHANSFLNKPFDPDEYPALVSAIEDFWQVWNVPNA
ncbi:MAG: hypothetical protein QOJ26_998 [Thermoplasmata archaeon]|jgi:CheY-like chemotaxis protein|nr:hypothetical protein [Thermoplasmata archaeon]MEA3166129.1 hypothetical protein [Thermoplasmata archaeon]